MILKMPKELDTWAWESTKTMTFHTIIKRSGTDKVRTMTNQLYPSWEINAKLNKLTNNQVRILFGFFAKIKGSYEPFLFLDPEDNSETDIRLPLAKVGEYQVIRKLGEFVEPVAYIENEKIYINGVLARKDEYELDNGIIRFKAPPTSDAKITASYTYYWKVMLADDKVGITSVFKNFNRSKMLKLVSVR